MKKYVLEFVKRGLMAAADGPVILAIIYGCLGMTGTVAAIAPVEAALGILSITLMAFIAAGITMIYFFAGEGFTIWFSIISAAIVFVFIFIIYRMFLKKKNDSNKKS